MQNLVLTSEKLLELNGIMASSEKLVYTLSESLTIPGELESRLMYKGQMLVFSSAETGGNIFKQRISKKESKKFVDKFGIKNLLHKELLLLIVANNYDDFLSQLNSLNDYGLRNILYNFFSQYKPFVVMQMTQ